MIKPIAAYGHAIETRSVAEFEALSEEGIKFQAQLVRDRLLGPAHQVSLEGIRTISQLYKNRGDLVRCIELRQHSLDRTQRHLKPFDSNTLSLGFDPIIKTFTDVLMAQIATPGILNSGALKPEQMVCIRPNIIFSLSLFET